MPHEVAVLAPHGVVAFDLTIPCQVLGMATLAENEARYRVTVCGVRRGKRVQTSNGFFLDCQEGPDFAVAAHTVVVPGTADNGWIVNKDVSMVLGQAAAAGARIVSICTGAFAVAAAGLLDGRRATTHWHEAPRLAKDHPSVDVDAHALYVQDGSIFTSAGLASGIDLCLHLVRLDYGAEVANVAARRMVVAPHRSGGQAQFIERPVSVAADQGLDGTREWILRNLERPLTLADMAAYAHRSTRSFSRHFVAETGLSPLQWLVDQRVRAAQTLLEAGDLDVEAIARACGFGSAVSLRQHFRKIVGTTPMAYRRSFLAPASERSGSLPA
jgi:transcriptional regulator GlxA family with amidase domain